MPDFTESPRQDMQQKPSDELICWQLQGFLPVVVGSVQVGKSDMVLINNLNPVIGDGDLVGVSGKILDYRIRVLKWGFDHIMTKKTKARASADVGFIFIAYNLRRLFTILGEDNIMAYMKAFTASFITIKTKISLYIDMRNQIEQVLDNIQNMRIFLSSVSQKSKIRKLATFDQGF